jgi:hypothetical protein
VVTDSGIIKYTKRLMKIGRFFSPDSSGILLLFGTELAEFQIIKDTADSGNSFKKINIFAKKL